MIIKLRGYLTYRDLIGQREIEKADEIPITLLEFIRELAGQYPDEHGWGLIDKGTVGQSVAIMLNGVHANHLPDRLGTVLKDQDEIAVFPPAAGG